MDTADCAHDTNMIRTTSGEWHCAACDEEFIAVSMAESINSEMIEHVEADMNLVINTAAETASRVVQKLTSVSTEAVQDAAAEVAAEGKTASRVHEPEPQLLKSPFMGMSDQEYTDSVNGALREQEEGGDK